MCMAPLWLGGLRGNKSTPSVAWEVPVKSHQSASGSCMEHAGQQLTAGYLGYDKLPLFLHGRLLVYFMLLVCMFNSINKMIDLEF
jgi:hypothetical protein